MSDQLNKQILELFQKDVAQYSEVERLIKAVTTQIKPLQDTLKNLKAEKKTIENDICKFMREREATAVNLPHVFKDGNRVDYSGAPAKAIKYTKIEAVAPVTQSQVKESLIRFFSSIGSTSKFQKLSVEEKGEIAFDFIYNKKNRQKKTRETLRKVKFIESEVSKKVDIEVQITDPNN